MTDKLRGLIHIHSEYSHDGKISLGELAGLCKTAGYGFMIITEHAESMDENKIKRFVSECKTLSDDDLIIIPGLEFICDGGLHILGFGIERNLAGSDPKDIINQIHADNGLAVLAHIMLYDNIPIKKLKELDGVEIWNSKYDGRFAPRLRHFSMLQEFRKENHKILGYGGLDLHRGHDFGKLSVYVTVDGACPRNVLDALKNGRFYFTNGFFAIDSKENPKSLKRVAILIVNILYDITNMGVSLGKTLFEMCNIKPPKKLLRIFRVMFR